MVMAYNPEVVGSKPTAGIHFFNEVIISLKKM